MTKVPPIELWGAETSRQSDRYTMETLGIPSEILMERAALAVSGEVQRVYEHFRHPILVLSGPGNNGADGLAVSRILAGRGIPVEVSLLAKDIRGNVAQQLEWARAYGVHVGLGLPEIPQAPRILVDALLGTGSRGIPKGSIAECLERFVPWQIKQEIPVVAVDIPTGIDADSGAVLGMAFHSRRTVTFQKGKPGLFITPGSHYAGQVVVAEIGLQADPVTSSSGEETTANLDTVVLLSPTWAAEQVAASFTAHEHKGQRGSLGVIGGSVGTPGAVILSGHAALKSGVGTVHVWSNDAQVQAQILRYRPELMGFSTPDFCTPGGWKSLLSKVAGQTLANAWVVGPGLTDAQGLSEIAPMFLDERNPSIWDAGTLDVIPFEARPAGPRVLSPHPGEASRMLNRWQEEKNQGKPAGVNWNGNTVQQARREVAMRLSQITCSTVILKGEHSLIAQNQRLAICPTGSSTLATAGSGDCLAGIVGALLARGMDAWSASCLAVYLHGMCGELLEVDHGSSGALAGDIADVIPKALESLRTELEPHHWPKFEEL